MKDYCLSNQEQLLSIEQALQRIESAVTPVTETELLPLSRVPGRVTAFSVRSAIDLPPHRVASMDGYAFASSDIAEDRSFALQTIGTSWAGKPFNGNLKAGQCVRIFTGAVVPDHADSVVMQEHVKVTGDSATFPPQTRGLQNIRQRGSDIKAHEELLASGKIIEACDCGLLASVGMREITVNRRLRISFFSTGDELTPTGSPLGLGQIYDSNRYALEALLKDERFSVADLGVVADDKRQLQQVLEESAGNSDVVISTGGASVGDADYIHEILDSYGQVNFWKVAIKPGKPLIFGKIGNSLFFGLPGNPVAVIVTFQKLVLPALQRLSGAALQQPLRIRAKCTVRLKKAPGRREYQRGILKQSERDQFTVDLAGEQDSHQLTALSRANCYIVLPAESEGVDAGDYVTVEPFSGSI